jgi:hypothetical protein
MYHNVMNLVRNWYFIQALPPRSPRPEPAAPRFTHGSPGGVRGRARGGARDRLSPQLQGLAMYPADSLRSRRFPRAAGSHVATLMDYSRFNYVAQPEDGVPIETLIPRVGPYDRYAVMWGHTPIPGRAQTPDEEWETLDRWSRMQDTIPWFRFTTPGAPNDPHAVTEAVGNEDAVRSSTLGMLNLERVVGSLLSGGRASRARTIPCCRSSTRTPSPSGAATTRTSRPWSAAPTPSIGTGPGPGSSR